MKIKHNIKGFTLIELLAVITILIIIAAISVPIVDNVIKESNDSAFELRKNQMIKAAKEYCELKKIKSGTISYQTLIDYGSLKPGIKNKDGDVFDGNVEIDPFNERLKLISEFSEATNLFKYNSNAVNREIAAYKIYGNTTTIDGVTTSLGETNNSIIITARGKNLFKNFTNLADFTNLPVLVNTREAGLIVWPGDWIFSNNTIIIPSNVSITKLTLTFGNLIPNEDYVFSMKTTEFQGTIYAFFGNSVIYNSNGYSSLFRTSDDGVYLNLTNSNKTIINSNSSYLTVPEDGIILSEFQLELGTQKTEYEPYVEPMTRTIDLTGHDPLRSVGNTRDYIEYPSGKIIRKVGVNNGELYVLDTPTEDAEKISMPSIPKYENFDGVTNISISDTGTISVAYYE